MKNNLLNRLGRLTTALVLTSVGLVGVATGANAAQMATSSPPKAVIAAVPLGFNINGPWTDNGSAKPVISVTNNTILVNMSYAHRPTAVGSVINASTIQVTFPDAGTYTAQLVAPNTLRWSNGSAWKKVYTGPTFFNLNGTRWTDNHTPGAPYITNTNGFLVVSMSDFNRPNAVGYVIDAGTISVSFPDAGTFLGKIQPTSPPTVIRWSNGTLWQSLVLR